MLSGLTYNIQFGNNLAQVTAWLTHVPQPFDILCFQEFPLAQIKTFTNKLKPQQYNWKYATSFIKQKGDFGELTLVNTKKLQLGKCGIVNLGTSFWEKNAFRIQGERSSLVTQLRYKSKSILVANTHLLALAVNQERRDQLIKVIAHLEKALADAKTPVVILGDFNYSSLYRRGKLFALMEERGFVNTHTAHTHRLFAFKSHQLDYIFSQNCRVQDIEVLKLPFSDHLPVRFTLAL